MIRSGATIKAVACLLCMVGVGNAGDLAGSTVQIGSDMTYPPYNYFDADKNPAGFDSEFMQSLADAGGFKIAFIDTRFENLIIGVSGKKFDVIASTLYIKPERAKQVDFIPYMKTGVSIGVAASGSFKPVLPEELCGKRVGLIKAAAYKVNLAEVSKNVCDPKGQTIDIREFPTSPEATQAVLSGNVDAHVDDSAVLAQAAEKTGGRVIVSSKENLFPVLVGLGLNKDNSGLKADLEEAFAKVKASGRYDMLLKKYNVSAPTSVEIQAATGASN